MLRVLPEKKKAVHTDYFSFGSPAVFREEDPQLSAPFSQRVRPFRENDYLRI
jgi:hypothetical protein